MEKLMKPAEYAQEQGISRQAVYAKIKRGVLKSKNIEGKLYIIIDSKATVSQSHTKTIKSHTSTTKKAPAKDKDYESLLNAKDETIAVLKETVVDLKESNKQISTTLKGEIDLLKDAFYEMRTLYVRQLEYKQGAPVTEPVIQNEVEEELDDEFIDIFTQEEEQKKEPEAKWIGIKKFFKIYNITKEKKQEKVMKRLTKSYKKGDDRLMQMDEKLKLDLNKNYEDILY